MNKKATFCFLSFFLFFNLFLAHDIKAQRTVGLVEYGLPNTDGYVMFSPLTSHNTYIIDKCGKQVHQWTASAYAPGAATYFLPDGSLIRAGKIGNPRFVAGGTGGIIEQFDWDGKKIWSYEVSDSLQCSHHDFVVMPNGNILMTVWALKMKDEALANGRKPALVGLKNVLSEKLIELKPIGTSSAEIVWQWELWDHLVQDADASKKNYAPVAEHPELLDINFAADSSNSDWIHMNALDFNPKLDQIMMSSYGTNEIWIIDHSTTTAEAASHSGGKVGKGGDFLYRWGNPYSYKRGDSVDKRLFKQHNCHWITPGLKDEGKIIIFNNGPGRPGGIFYSSLDIIAPPITDVNAYTIIGNQSFGPIDPSWQYTAPVPTDFYSTNLSSVQLLPNGSTIVALGASGSFIEFDNQMKKVWKYVNPISALGPIKQGVAPSGNIVFRCAFFPKDFAGFTGHTLTPTAEIELSPNDTSLCQLASVKKISQENISFSLSPNPSQDKLHISRIDGLTGMLRISIYNLLGETLFTKAIPSSETEITIDVSTFTIGSYYLSLESETGKRTQKWVKM